MRNISRRNFLKGVAASAAGVAASGVMGAYAESAAPAAAPAAAPVAAPAVLNPTNPDYRKNSIADFSKSKVFTPWNFGKLTVANRIAKSAAGSDTLGSWQTTPEEFGEYYANFARGGTSFVWIEGAFSVYTSFGDDPKPVALDNPALKYAIDAIHAAGSLVGVQFQNMSIPGVTMNGTMADTLTKEQIAMFAHDVAAVSYDLKTMGVDAIELNNAGNNAGQSFMSRNRNHRDDEYGPQSIENRARFTCDVIRAVKEKCGADFPVQVLINGIEENDAKIGDNALHTTVAECKEICKQLEAAGADSLHVRLGPDGQHICQFASDLYFTGVGIEGSTAYGTQFDFSRHWEGMLDAKNSGAAMMVDVAAAIKSAVSIPVGTVTYLDPAVTPDLIEDALQKEKVDFLLMTRPLTVDPEYANKLRENRLDEIAPCTRCMHCHQDKDAEGKRYEHCRVNACTQRAYHDVMPEGYIPTPAAAVKNVMVIGGGPGGMEAARIAAERGHKVTLYEKKGYLGGLLPFANAIKGPHENLDKLVAYLTRQLELKGVEVVMGTEVTADLIAEKKPDAIVLAVGGKRAELPFASTAGTNVISVDDVASAPVGNNVTILGGNVQSVDVALYLLNQGKNVTIVTNEALDKFEKGHSAWVKNFVKPMIFARGTRVWPNAKITEVGNGEINILGETGISTAIKCDTIIDASDALKNTALIDGLGIEAYAVGDCNNPWNIAEAINDANLIARKL